VRYPANATPATLGVTSRKNGLVNGQLNGASSRVASNPAKQNGVPTPSKASVTSNAPDTAGTPLSTPVVNGKKRKKSMG